MAVGNYFVFSEAMYQYFFFLQNHSILGFRNFFFPVAKLNFKIKTSLNSTHRIQLSCFFFFFK